MNKRTNLHFTYAVSLLVILFSSLFIFGQAKTTNYLITATSVGEIKLGMTIAEARKVSKGLEFSRKVIGLGDLLISVKNGSKELMILNANEGNEEDKGGDVSINEKAKVASINVLDSRYKTANGVHPKMTIAAAEKRYGKIKMIYWDDEVPEVGKFETHPNGFDFYLEGIGNKRDSNGRTKAAGNYKLNDYQTTKYNRGSYISSIWIHSGNGQIDDSDSSSLITATAVGNVKLGMTIGEARKALPSGFTLGPGGGSEGVSFVGVFDGKKHLMDIGEYEDSQAAEKLPPINNNQKIRGISIIDSRFKTAEGVHVGMLIADAEKKYGKLKEMFSYPHEGEFGSFTNQPEYLKFYFKPKGDFSGAGIYEAVPNCPEDAYPPSCRIAKKYNPNSYIFEMAVSSPQPIQQVVSITDTPKDYKVNIYGPMKCVEDEEPKTTYSISWKVPMETGGYKMPSQGFDFKGLKPCPELGKNRMYLLLLTKISGMYF